MNRILRAVVTLTTLSILTACATVEDVSRFATLPRQGPESTALLLIVHGSGDSADSWPLELERAVRDHLPSRTRWDIVRVDWAPVAERRLSAPEAGRALGHDIAQEIIDGPYTYDLIHMVGHSVGAHVVHGVTTGLREHESAAGVLPRHRMIIHETLLDPFVGEGIFDWSYGVERFGKGADFALSYMTSDDRTPMTNTYLRHAHNLDLSLSELATPIRGVVESHYLPVLFYRRSVANVEETGPGFALAPYVWAPGAQPENLFDGYALFSELYPPGAVTPKVVD
jgi:hypothetical protein